MDSIAEQQALALRRAELESLSSIDFAVFEATVRKWLILPDKGILKLLCAYYIAHHTSNKGVWLMLIAPSGGGKTALLDGLLSLPACTSISSLTPNTFLSGMPGGKDASLLPKINNKIAIFKDFTTILSMQKDARAEIFSQFREIWDGSMTKPFGNGKIAVWKGKVSILAASTQAIDIHQQMYAHLGERFLNYRIEMPDRKTVALRSLENNGAVQKMEREIQDAFYALFKGIDLTKLGSLPALPEEIKQELVNLADFSTMARSGVIRDFGLKKEVVFVPAPEMPTRLVQQLHILAVSLTVLNGGKYVHSDMDIIYKAALDSIPQTNRMVIMEMAKADEQTTKEIAMALGYPTGPIRLYLENLALLGVCRRILGSDSAEGGTADKWTMKPEFTAIIRHYEKIEALTATELKTRQEEAQDEADADFEEFGKEAAEAF